MALDEKRKNLRTDSLNLLFYICCDENNNEMLQGMGKTLNVSEGGIMLETHVSIDVELNVLLTIAIEDDLMDFKGKIVHSRKREDGKFEYGIDFVEINHEKRLLLRQYMIIFIDPKYES